MIEIWIDHLPRSRPSSEVLSIAEAAHATQLGSAERRGRFIATRVWVREQLGARLGVAPAQVPLFVDERGALSLTSDDLRISLSHHRSLIALALSSSGAVGVDVLCIPNDASCVRDTALVLSSSEIELVRRASPRRRGTVFAHCWTRKEAFAKIFTEGLRASLTDVTLSASSAESCAAVWSCRVADAVVAVASPGRVLPPVTLVVGV
jgi:4'-phosphopantetheinyl transferase